MEIQTKFFDTIRIKEEEIITFKQGLPGFESHHDFVLIQATNEYKVLQSLHHLDVAFIVVNPFLFEKEYEFSLSDYALETLNITSEQDIEVLAIVTISKQWTMNLLAPVILNVKTMSGMQVVLDQTTYHTKHIMKNEVA